MKESSKYVRICYESRDITKFNYLVVGLNLLCVINCECQLYIHCSLTKNIRHTYPSL